MKVTVCEFRNDPGDLEADWDRLIRQVNADHSDLVLLPEMPFAPWVASTRTYDEYTWQAFVESHDRWMPRLKELSPAVVLGSRPISENGSRLNEGFVWDGENGYRGVHRKHYLPDETDFWEASWYRPGPGRFDIIETPAGKIGFLICTEMWFTAHAIDYAANGIQILACPRATGRVSVEKWKSGGVAAAVMAGAYCLSSNRGGVDSKGLEWAGAGWVIGPDEGRILGLTSQSSPFLTVEIDLSAADQAKKTYPRYLYA